MAPYRKYGQSDRRIWPGNSAATGLFRVSLFLTNENNIGRPNKTSPGSNKTQPCGRVRCHQAIIQNITTWKKPSITHHLVKDQESGAWMTNRERNSSNRTATIVDVSGCVCLTSKSWSGRLGMKMHCGGIPILPPLVDYQQLD